MQENASPSPYTPPTANPIQTAEDKHSGPGIASFVIALLSGISLFILLLVAGIMETSTPGGIDENSTIAAVIGLFFLLLMAIAVIGLGLGIGGLCQQKRKKIFAILGVVFSVVVLLLGIFIIVLGLSMG